MSSWTFGFDLIITFLLAAFLLFHYGNWYTQSILVTLLVLIAWYFSFIIIFLLPLDISTTTHLQCLQIQLQNNQTCPPPPSSYIGTEPLFELWRVVYWSSQALTWILLPLTISYTLSGEFSTKNKFKSALLDNAIYYSIYLFICVVLLIYLATIPNLVLNFNQLKAIASSASNSWGLFLLVFMLGYGLVEVPRSLYSRSCNDYINYCYFKVGKLSEELGSCEEALSEVLDSFQSVKQAFRHEYEIMEKLIPTELLERRRGEVCALVEYKSVVKLHKNLKKCLQNKIRVQEQLSCMINDCVKLEKSLVNFCDGTWFERLYCKIYPKLLKTLAVVSGLMSLLVIWSEATFFVKYPVLSVFASIIESTENYLLIEIISTMTIAYMAVCAFYTVFKIRVFNFYYLAHGHNTDEYSLCFSGMLLSRLTPPLCLNVISLLHLDSHVLKNEQIETSYTKVMGHMDVLSIISDGFNIYFPMGILLVSLLTWFKVGSRILAVVGFEQFLVDDEMSEDLVGEGRRVVGRRINNSNRRRAILNTNPSYSNSTTVAEQPPRPQPPLIPPRDLFSDV